MIGLLLYITLESLLKDNIYFYFILFKYTSITYTFLMKAYDTNQIIISWKLHSNCHMVTGYNTCDHMTFIINDVNHCFSVSSNLFSFLQCH